MTCDNFTIFVHLYKNIDFSHNVITNQMIHVYNLILMYYAKTVRRQIEPNNIMRTFCFS